MTNIPRQTTDRRARDRRSYESNGYDKAERRSGMRRAYVDRRGDPFWRFSWLRASISQQLSG